MAGRYARGRKATGNAHPENIAQGLGWFSVGLGVAQLLAPRAVCRIVGVPVSPMMMRLSGLRTVACGIGILSGYRPHQWLQGRVAGDVSDLASLAGAAFLRGADRRRIAVAMVAAGGLTALDAYCSRELAVADAKVPRHLKTTIAVDRSPEELYRYWREFENFPRLMPHIESVQPLGGDCYHWVAKGPAGTRVEWDSEVIDDQPNERLAWRSLDGSDVFNAGSVRFDRAPGGGTYVTVELLYEPPAGTIGATVAKLFGRDPGAEVRADLEAFKQLMETKSPTQAQG